MEILTLRSHRQHPENVPEARPQGKKIRCGKTRSGFRLSRNYRFADKQERTVGRSKVVQKFPYGNFFPLKV